MDFFGLRRTKTLSESSDDGGYNGVGVGKQQQHTQKSDAGESSSQKLMRSLSSAAASNNTTGANLQTNAVEGRYFHDDVGMVPYSFYEKKPEFYDDHGKITYKYFNQYKALDGKGSSNSSKSSKTSSSSSSHQDDNSFFYDLDGGKVPFHTYYYPTDRKRFTME